MHFSYEFSKHDIDWNFKKKKFEYLVQISFNPHEPKYLLIFPGFFGYASLKISKEEINVPCDSSSSFNSSLNKEDPCIQVNLGEHENQFFDPTPSSLSPHIQDLNSNFNF